MPLEPDVATRISLIGTAERMQSEKTERAEAIATLQKIAGRRTELLSDAAGYFLGAGLWNSAYCHMLLVDAGANDRERIAAAADEVRKNRAKVGLPTAGSEARR